MISVVIPCYRTSLSLMELYTQLVTTFDNMNTDFEVIFVNDCSPENDWEIISSLACRNGNVKGINLSRNFGQQIAIMAGLKKTCGEWVVVMDGDLQDSPEEIIKLFNKSREGYDIVRAQRCDRKDRFFKKIFSRLFYSILSYLTETKQDPSIGNFGIYSRKAINSIVSMGDLDIYFPSMIQWVGYQSTAIEINHQERIYGKTSYNFFKLLKMAFNIMVTFSDKPLRLTTKTGAFISLFSGVFALIYFIQALLGNIIVQGWASLIISLWFLSGVQIALIGMVGLYVGKTFDSVKNRPLYIIKEEV